MNHHKGRGLRYLVAGLGSWVFVRIALLSGFMHYNAPIQVVPRNQPEFYREKSLQKSAANNPQEYNRTLSANDFKTAKDSRAFAILKPRIMSSGLMLPQSGRPTIKEGDPPFVKLWPDAKRLI
jgi:hypothetical protein